MLADRLGQRAVADLPIEHLLELGIAARDGVADDDQVEVGRDVLRACSPASVRDPLLPRGSRSSADRRPDPIRGRRSRAASASPRASPSPCRRRRSDGCASMLSCDRRLLDDRARGPVAGETRRARRTAASCRRRSCGRREARTGPGREIGAARRRTTARAVGLVPPARRTRGSSPKTTPAAAPSRPARRSCVSMPIQPIRPLGHFVDEQHIARAADRRRTACRATPAAASACRRPACPAASPGRTSRPAGGSARRPARAHETRVEGRSRS